MVNTAVLFITYNRLDLIKETFEQIRKAKPCRLYLSSDGPKEDKPGDTEKVNAVREWLDQAVDWSCLVRKKYSSTNQGCQMGPANAISWVFEYEEQVIILEDDILVDMSFFTFCEEMLRRYSNDKRVMLVSGYKRLNDYPIEQSYFFSYAATMWGWATWKRAWEYFDVKMEKWPEFKREKRLSEFFVGGIVPRFTEQFDETFRGELDAWDYPWILSCLYQKGLCVFPRVNLIKNIGFDSKESTHTRGKSPEFYVEPLEIIDSNVEVERNIGYDRAVEKTFYKDRPLKRFVRKICPKKILNIWYKLRER